MASRRPKATRHIPITGISVYMEEMKIPLQESEPTLTRMEICAALNDQWSRFDEEIKAMYERQADYMRRAVARKVAFRKRRLSRASRGQARISSYSIFLRVMHESLKEGNPEMTLSMRAAAIAQAWHEMPKGERLPFVNTAKRENRKMRQQSVDEDASDHADSADE